MTPFTSLVGWIVLFSGVAVFFLFSVLLIGKLVRPNLPNAEKTAIYECGEPTIGSSWVQFDLRFYVVALLFVIFDVEVAFFFPWAVVFGKAAQVADPTATAADIQQPLADLGFAVTSDVAQTQQAAGQLARIAFFDLLVFFGVVLVGFAYLWRRGDLDWVRASTSEAEQAPASWSPPADKEAASEPLAVP